MLTHTTTQILDSLRDPSNGAMWSQFDQRFRPVLIAFARGQGLSEDDAADVAQTTLTQFTADYQAGRYDRTRGRLSSWIIGIAQHRVIDLLRAGARRRIERGESAIDNRAHAPGDGALNDAWRMARERVLSQKAMDVLRTQSRLDERTIKAFELSAVRSVPPEAVAAECGMSVPEVYVAKNRVIKKLKEIVAHLTQEFDDE